MIRLTERIVLSDTNCNHGSDVGHVSYMVKTTLANWDGGFLEQSYHRRKSRQWFEGECYLRELSGKVAQTRIKLKCSLRYTESS